MKLRNKKTAIISMVLLVAFAVASFGFAAWSQQININGTVSAAGNFELKVTAASIVTQSAGNTASASKTDTVATFNLGTLAFPGDVVTFSTTITNTGTIAADLVTINSTLDNVAIPGWSYVGLVNGNHTYALTGATYLKLAIAPITPTATEYETLAPAGTCTIVSSVYVDSTYDGTINVTNATASLDFGYIAKAVAGTIDASHT
ncbi:MAG: hypothetical protein LBS74_10890 [Oscillospiraceae bacterium]|jgi:uncharacterized repeat protein (TIGR01451 family)|nr:hypothetical protein [Oscillospiraceae bacterium]